MPELRHKRSAFRRNCAGSGAAAGLNLGLPPKQGKRLRQAGIQRPAGKQKRTSTMTNNRTEPNTELQRRFEPLRITFAVLALLLGAIAAAHF
jgi:hypothetical protein